MYYLSTYIFISIISFLQLNKKNPIIEKILWINTIFFLIFFYGFRDNVGGDWWVYEKDFNLINIDDSFLDMYRYGRISSYEIGYFILSVTIKKIGLTIHYVNFIISLFFYYSLNKFCSINENRFLSLAICFPILILVISSGFVRQSISIAFFLLALTNLIYNNKKSFLFLILISGLFHISSLIFTPFYFFINKPNLKFKSILINAVIFTIVFLLMIFLYKAKLFNLFDIYFLGATNVNNFDYPKGASFRVGITLLAAFIFFIFRNELSKNANESIIFFLLSLMTVATIILLNFFIVFVDRINFYLIPIQVLVFSRLPYIFGGFKNQLIVHIYVILFYLLILSVWLTFSTHIRFWIPYKNYIFN